MREGIRPELGLQLSYAFTNDIEGGEHSGPGARVQLLARFNSYIAAGPELAFYLDAGSERIVRFDPSHGDTYSTSKGPLLQLAGVLRVGFDKGVIRPAFLVGPAAAMGSSSTDLFYFLGAQLTFMLGRVPLSLDARIYRPVTGSLTGYPNSQSLGLGTRISW
ncbi:hypothetical protein [Pyxidicoccus caerfyrddinensis]|uniref:hypothetical protein n=1 Tax=Pyxidicoccus caerfyrddinensis TaxID=2709663 RepID=UPI0013D9ACC1|nr:hypothetical protein [Pyxidicoccus caerfyrddinensis]